jgi:hypothetical protein
MTTTPATTPEIVSALTIKVALATQLQLDHLAKVAADARAAANAAEVELANARRDAAAGLSPGTIDCRIWSHDDVRRAADAAAERIDGQKQGITYWRLHAHPMDREPDGVVFLAKLFPDFNPTEAIKHGSACHHATPGAMIGRVVTV